jgi:4-hydroxybenzoate polyprenyltransferase
METTHQASHPVSLVGRGLILLRCGSCRFAAYYFLSFQIAIIDGGYKGWRWCAFGVYFWLLHSLGIELLNRYSDRIEDQVNRPERTALCEIIGYGALKTCAITIWIVIIATYAFWLLLQPNALLCLLLFAGLLAGIGYSVGVRFKAKRYLALVLLTFPFGGPFLIGWAATHTMFSRSELVVDLFRRLGPFLWVAGLFFIGHAGIKDITDAPGDRRAGYRSIWVDLVETRAYGIALIVVSLWLSFCILFVVLGALPLRFCWLLTFAPVSLVFATSSLRAGNGEERNAVRELFYHYWFAFLSVALYLIAPKPAALITISGTLVYWILASQFLHWSAGITLTKLRTVGRLMFGRLYKSDVRTVYTGAQT